MKLYLVQHGLAKSADEDPKRPLSPQGIEETEKTALFLASKSLNPKKIFHSSKLRAKETAGIIAAKTSPGVSAIEKEGLAPKDDPVIWMKNLEEENDDVMLVGHLPQLARLASLLLCGNSEKEVVRFSNSCVVCLERNDDGLWRLVWAAPTRLL